MQGEYVLPGGMGNAGGVVRVGQTVRRPRGDHAPAVSMLLAHVEAVGFPAPVALGTDAQGRDSFRWIDGEVAVPPFPEWSLADEALASVGRLLRRYHDSVQSFRPPQDAKWSTELADPVGGSLVCHNDVCPENVVFRNGEAAALLDFDFAAPGRPVWDLAAAAAMWIPLRPSEPADNRVDLARLRRLAVFVNAYGLADADRLEFVDALVLRKRVGGAFFRRRVDAGEPPFVEMWKERGGSTGDARVVAWLEASRQSFLSAVQRPSPRTG